MRRRAVDIGCTGIMVSNHGGRQLDGSRSPFDQLAEIVDAVGDKLDVICEGGIQRGTHMLKGIIIRCKSMLRWKIISICLSCWWTSRR